MNFDLKCLWVAFLITLYGSIQKVEAISKIPKTSKTVQSIVECLEIVIGDDFVPEWFKGRLTGGDFIDEFCLDKDISNVIEKMKKYKDKPNIAEMKPCLEHNGQMGLHEEYFDFGQKKFDELESSSIISEFPPSESQEQDASKDYVNKEEILNLSKFVLGMCYKDSPMKYAELEDDEDKQNTISCLQSCASELFHRIDIILGERRSKIRAKLRGKGNNEAGIKLDEIDRTEFPKEIEYIKEQSTIYHEINKCSFNQEFDNDEKRNLERITNVGEKFLKLYEESYILDEKFLSAADENFKQEIDTQMINNPKTIDDRLSSSFIYYESCNRRQCYMDISALPIKNYFQNITKERTKDKEIYAKAQARKETKLPKSSKVILYIADCVLDTFGDDFIPKWFRGKLHEGEVIGQLCRDINISNVVQTMKRYSTRSTITLMKPCLKDYAQLEVYEDYFNFGQKEFDRLQPSSQNSQSLSPENQEQSASEKYKIKEEILNLSKFVIGMCFKDKPMKYLKLQNDGDRKITIKCLESCASRFINRIEEILQNRTSIIERNLNQVGISEIEILLNKIDRSKIPDEAEYIEGQAKLYQKYSTLSFYREFYNSEKKDLQTITNIGKKFLKLYNEAYTNEEEFLAKADANFKRAIDSEMRKDLTNDDDHKKNEDIVDTVTTPQKQEQYPDNKEIVDDRLRSSSEYYKMCARMECFMEESSLPIYDYIHEEVKERKSKIVLSAQTQSSVPTGDKAKEPETGTENNNAMTIEPPRNLFEALIKDDDILTNIQQ